jgi:hypothetical protein
LKAKKITDLLINTTINAVTDSLTIEPELTMEERLKLCNDLTVFPSADK